MKKNITCLLLLLLPVLVSARLMRTWTYQQMFDQADLVVIARPLMMKGTSETNTLPNLKPPIQVIGLNTDFEVRTVMKGLRTNKFVLHHYRLDNPPQIMMDGPMLVAFDPAQHHSFLLFLTKEPDGRYAPVTGQTDPGFFSVLKLDGTAD